MSLPLVLATRWWMVALRGIAAIVFGIVAFMQPGAGLLALVFVFGAYALVDGGFKVASAVRGRGAHERWSSVIAGGAVSILIGVLTLLLPVVTAFVLLLLIATWSIVAGLIEIVGAIRLRKEIEGEWLLALSGLLSVAFGVLLLLMPRAGALAVALWVGVYAVAYGVLLLALSLRLRAWNRNTRRTNAATGVATSA